MTKIKFENGITVEVDGEPSHEQVTAIWNDLQSQKTPDSELLPEDVRPKNKYLSALEDSVKAIPVVSTFTQPDIYPKAFMGGLQEPMREALNVPEEQEGLMSMALKLPGTSGGFVERGANLLRDREDIGTPRDIAKATAAEVVGNFTAPINYAIPAAIEAAGLIPVGKFTVGELLKLPPNRIKDAITGKVAPEVVERFLNKISVLKKMGKHLPSNIKNESIIPQESPEVQVKSKLMKEIKSAKPLRREQEALYTKERTERFGRAEESARSQSGQASYANESELLSGELPKTKYEAIGSKFSQAERDSLDNMVKGNPKLSYIESYATRKALRKMYNGELPNNSDIALLQQTFGDEVADALFGRLPLSEKLYRIGVDILGNSQRAIKSAFDLSAPFRQGLPFIGNKEWWAAWKPMIKALHSDTAYETIMKDIYTRTNYKLMKQSKLFLADLGSSLTNAEESFSSRLANKIPGIKQSNRAFNAFLNKLKADMFDKMLKDYEAMGADPSEAGMKIANFLNVFTGRGSSKSALGGVVSRNAELLNMILYSARFQLSRWQILNPMNYIQADPVLRKYALKSLAGYVGANISFLGFAKLMGAKIELDPRSSDFMKARFGKTRMDIGAGFPQIITLAARLITGQTKTEDGRIVDIDKNSFLGQSRLTVLTRFLEFKESPLASFVSTLLRGKTVLGEELGKETSIPKEIWKMYEPMVASDIWDLLKDKDAKNIIIGSPLAVAGGSVNVYNERAKENKTSNKIRNRIKARLRR